MNHIIRMGTERVRALRFAVPIIGVGILAGQTACYRRAQPDERRSAVEMPPGPLDTLVIDDIDTAKPSSLSTGTEYPDPFSTGGTVIPLKVEKPSEVVLKIYNKSGRWVRTLCSTFVAAPGDYHITWSGIDASGNTMPSEIYFRQLTANDTTITRKMVLMRKEGIGQGADSSCALMIAASQRTRARAPAPHSLGHRCPLQ